MRADQAIDAVARARRRIERRQHGGVIVLQHFEKQRARQFLLRSEAMEEAAIRGARAGANGRDGRAFEAVTVEHRQSGRQQILSNSGDHDRPCKVARSVTLEYCSIRRSSRSAGRKFNLVGLLGNRRCGRARGRDGRRWRHRGGHRWRSRGGLSWPRRSPFLTARMLPVARASPSARGVCRRRWI